MRFDLNLRSKVRQQLQEIAGEMKSWQTQEKLGEDELAHIRESVRTFNHTSERANLTVAGATGSGDFPSLSYADSFIYLTVAQGVIYGADRMAGLRELGPELDPTIQITWLSMNREMASDALDAAFSDMAGEPLLKVIEQSDYRVLKAQETGKSTSPNALLRRLIRPEAGDVSNLAIQLKSTATLGAALRILRGETKLSYLLLNTTFSLPLVSNRSNSLFYEHLKRLCCIEACQRQIGFFALSKSHGLPGVEKLESIAAEVQERPAHQAAEHWYMRIPESQRDGWQLSLTKDRRLPPPGTVSYLVRFHRTTPVLRLDMDYQFWVAFVQGETDDETRAKERKIFEDLDYTCHDQRVYGYPYPIEAAQGRGDLSISEREAFRKQVIAAGLQQGMNPALFKHMSKASYR